MEFRGLRSFGVGCECVEFVEHPQDALNSEKLTWQQKFGKIVECGWLSCNTVRLIEYLDEGASYKESLTFRKGPGQPHNTP